MQAIVIFCNENNKINKFSINNSNFSNNNKIFIVSSKFYSNDNFFSNYFDNSNVKMANANNT